jgi:hypothetical protein
LAKLVATLLLLVPLLLLTFLLLLASHNNQPMLLLPLASLGSQLFHLSLLVPASLFLLLLTSQESLLWLKVSAVASVHVSVDSLSAGLVFPTLLTTAAVVNGPAVAGILLWLTYLLLMLFQPVLVSLLLVSPDIPVVSCPAVSLLFM